MGCLVLAGDVLQLDDGSFSTMPTPILPTDLPPLMHTAVEEAVRLLRAGDVVALPTETVYGLAADALNPAAVAKAFL
jgi:L-threonylcarbamoyladenylate synthase